MTAEHQIQHGAVSESGTQLPEFSIWEHFPSLRFTVPQDLKSRCAAGSPSCTPTLSSQGTYGSGNWGAGSFQLPTVLDCRSLHLGSYIEHACSWTAASFFKTPQELGPRLRGEALQSLGPYTWGALMSVLRQLCF